MSRSMKGFRYVMAIPEFEGDEGYFLFLKNDQKFRTKNPVPPIGGTG